MITNRELERLLSGHWKSLTTEQQIQIARELLTYRKARAEYQPGWGDDPVQASIEAFVEMRIEGNG